MRISVIMPVNLFGYETNGIKSATDPEMKFRRAVNCFLRQSFKDSELIIVSDGCKKSEEIYKEYQSELSVKFYFIPKQTVFSGFVRQTGLKSAQGEIICYLDHDDMIGRNHLQIISDNFDTSKYGSVYFNDWIVVNSEYGTVERDVIVKHGFIGTSSFAHRKDLNLVWPSGYGHDWQLIKSLKVPPHKIPTPQYYVCHTPTTDF